MSPATRHGGAWVYGEHPGLNPGWRYRDTPLVLDFDRLNGSCSPQGAYTLWIDGRETDAIDHFLDGAMDWVERHLADYLPVAAASPTEPPTPEG